MKYDVTIGMPVFRSEPYIRQALESALAQTYPSIEFLIVDDCGDDGSMEIVSELCKSHSRGTDIRILTHTLNEGVSASRNHLIDEAKGDYLYFMDSDDVIAENAIELLMLSIQQYHAEIAFGSYEKIELSGQRVVCQYPSLQLLGDDKLAVFAYRKYGGIQASACNYLVMLSVLREHRLRFIDADYWEDMAFTFNLVTYIRRAVLLSDITYTYCCRENSLSHYQERECISKQEIMQNVAVIEYLKESSLLLYKKVYLPWRCYNIMMTDFYIACHVLKNRKIITPALSDGDIKLMMSHPASFRQICSSRQARLKNLAFFLLGKLPAISCVAAVWCMGKIKKLL